MVANELMHGEVICVREEDLVEDALHTLVDEHLHGAPVVNESGELVGVISQQDVYFGGSTAQARPGKAALTVAEIMTSPAVFATEETTVVDLCRTMCRLRIHRLPVVDEGRVVGIVSSLDICAAVAEGRKLD